MNVPQRKYDLLYLCLRFRLPRRRTGPMRRSNGSRQDVRDRAPE